MNNNILVEKHYLTPEMYRETYNPYYNSHYCYLNPYYNTLRGVQPATTPLFSNIPTSTSQYTSLYAPTQSSIPTPTLSSIPTPTLSSIPTPITTHPPVLASANTPVSVPVGTNNTNDINSRIMNILNTILTSNGRMNEMNRTIQVEVSNIPFNQFIDRLRNQNINTDTDDNNESNLQITLSNINQISNVSVFINENSENSETELCAICQNNLEENDIIRTLNRCNHIFHLNCIDRWLSEHNTCPTCRNDLLNDNHNNQIEHEHNDNDDDDDDDDDDNDDNDNDDNEELDSESDIESETTVEETGEESNIANSEINGFTRYFTISNNGLRVENTTTSNISSIPTFLLSALQNTNTNTTSTTNSNANNFQNDILNTPQSNTTNITNQASDIFQSLNPIFTVLQGIVSRNNN